MVLVGSEERKYPPGEPGALSVGPALFSHVGKGYGPRAERAAGVAPSLRFYHGLEAETTGKASAQRLCGANMPSRGRERHGTIAKNPAGRG